MDHDHLESLRVRHPAWRLLRADSAPFVAAVLHRVFVAGNCRTISEDSLLEAVDDELFRLRQAEPGAFPRLAKHYVADWADPGQGWLRKFYPRDSDRPSYDLTPAAEKALIWLDSLAERSFVGTESRLLTLFELLQQIVEGSEDDPAQRLAILHQRRAELDAEIARTQRGEVRVLDETAVRDRFQQFAATARELLSDFREVEENFRFLDRGVREQIAAWEGSRGSLLDDVFGERDAIADSDQGVSFRAFWDFLMAADRQEEFGRLLETVMTMPALRSPDPTLRNVLRDWLVAADSVQATVAQLSQQLRRFLDDRAYLENRRISELVRSIEAQALQVRDSQPGAGFAAIDDTKADISMPMARRMYEPARSISLVDTDVEPGDEDFSADALYCQFSIDSERLRRSVAQTLSGRAQVSLAEVVAEHPVTQGLAEIVTYLSLADGDPSSVFVADQRQAIRLQSGPSEQPVEQSIEIPLIVFTTAESEAPDG